MDELLCISQGKGWAEFGYVPEVIEGCFTEKFYVGVKSELWVNFDT